MNQIKVISDVEYFFDLDSQIKREIKENAFYEYTNKEILDGFRWLKDCNSVLDYGCGVGLTLRLYLIATNNQSVNYVGVDISGGAVKRIEEDYGRPSFKFYQIKDNKIPQIADNSMDGAYLVDVLHHSVDHLDMFSEIYKKLRVGGKFFICDLSTSNFIINLGRSAFVLLPQFIKNRFLDDLVVDGAIPEKFESSFGETLELVKKAGFEIEEVGFGHLFVFIFDWMDRIFGISKIPGFHKFLDNLIRFEKFVLKYRFFQKNAHLYYLKCIKK